MGPLLVGDPIRKPKVLLVSILGLCFLATAAAAAAAPVDSCRSKELEIKWHRLRSPSPPELTQERRLQGGTNNNIIDDVQLCDGQSLQDAKKDAWDFLRNHVMDCDKLKMETMGFGALSQPDGLGQGLIGPTIDLALQAKMDYPWTDALPKDIFYEYVLNYANLNEARSNWRPLLWDRLTPLVHAKMNATHPTPLEPNDVVRLVNQHLWNAFPGHESIYFHSGQTPLIFDPMSVIVFGYASCTGLAILLVSALRTVGIPARVVGTPAWNANPDKGNHNWVEVYHHSPASTMTDATTTDKMAKNEWIFFEPSANQTQVDDLTTKPCSKWFCGPGRFPSPAATAGSSSNVSQVYAARLVFDDNAPSSSSSSLFYPMPWEWDSRDVPGENRTQYYQRVCSQC